jgi:predicted enzyme related to lactoylglutathione lyase
MAELKRPTPDLDESVRRAVERGGRIRVPTRNTGAGRYSVIEDPAGGVAALFEPPAP